MVGFARRKHGPDNARILVGYGDNGLVVASSFMQIVHPFAVSICLSFRGANDCSRTVHKQRSKVSISSFSKTKHYSPIASGVLSRYKAEPGCEVATITELGAVASGRYHGGCRFRSDAWY